MRDIASREYQLAVDELNAAVEAERAATADMTRRENHVRTKCAMRGITDDNQIQEQLQQSMVMIAGRNLIAMAVDRRIAAEHRAEQAEQIFNDVVRRYNEAGLV